MARKNIIKDMRVFHVGHHMHPRANIQIRFFYPLVDKLFFCQSLCERTTGDDPVVIPPLQNV